MASEERVRAFLDDAGFAVLRAEDVPVRFVYESVEDYLRRVQDTGGIFSQVWREAPEEEREAIRERLAADFTGYETDGGCVLPGVALCVSAS